MSWGLHKAGFKVLAGLDNWKPALKTFKLNHSEALAVDADLSNYAPADLRKRLGLDSEGLDCLVGGPPCQGFSKNVPAAYRFLEDPRNQLHNVFLDFVAELRPKVVLMENVAEIFNAYDGHVRKEFVSALREYGYRCEVKVLFAPDYGIPQRRRRCFFFATNTGITPKFPETLFSREEELTLLGSKPKYRSAWSAISDLPSLANGEGSEPMDYALAPQNDYQAHLRDGSKHVFDHVTRNLKDTQYARIVALKPGEGYKQLPKSLQPKSGYSGAYGRLDLEMIAPTITRWVFHPGSGRFCHPKDVRLITIREAARLQSFSDDFRFTGTYINKAHQVGNAVPPLWTEILADSVKDCLQKASQ